MRKEILPRRSLIVLAGVLLLGIGKARAEDDADHFLLPETPPTIERMKRPPMDRPVPKRQNFISDEDIVAPPVLLDNDFRSFFSPEYPVMMGIARGSFASSYGDFVYTAESGWQLSYHMLDSAGEAANLARNDHTLLYRLDRCVIPEVRLGGSVSLDQNTIWDQRHNLYHLAANAEWYGWQNMNIKARVAADRGEIAGVESDASFYGDLAVTLQPVERQNLAVSFSPRQDSAFAHDASFCTTAVMYDIQASPWITAGAGARYQKNTLYPQGEVLLRLLPRLSCSILYQPGIDRPEWAKLYANDRFELTNPALVAPESSFLLKERFSYYWGENSYLNLSFSQGQWKNYIYWSQQSGTSFVAPANATENYVGTIELEYRHAGKLLTPAFGLQMNSHADLPFVPDYTMHAGIATRYAGWDISAEYRYVPAMYYATTVTNRLAAYGNLLVHIAREIVPGIEITAGGDNVLGQTIETQPGFVRKSPAFRAGLNLKF